MSSILSFIQEENGDVLSDVSLTSSITSSNFEVPTSSLKQVGVSHRLYPFIHVNARVEGGTKSVALDIPSYSLSSKRMFIRDVGIEAIKEALKADLVQGEEDNLNALKDVLPYVHDLRSGRIYDGDGSDIANFVRTLGFVMASPSEVSECFGILDISSVRPNAYFGHYRPDTITRDDLYVRFYNISGGAKYYRDSSVAEINPLVIKKVIDNHGESAPFGPNFDKVKGQTIGEVTRELQFISCLAEIAHRIPDAVERVRFLDGKFYRSSGSSTMGFKMSFLPGPATYLHSQSEKGLGIHHGAIVGSGEGSPSSAVLRYDGTPLNAYNEANVICLPGNGFFKYIRDNGLTTATSATLKEYLGAFKGGFTLLE